MAFQANWLVYDIPENCGYPNPTNWLRPLAIRVNKSCWVILAGDIPWNRLNTMKSKGVDYHVVPFAPEAATKIIEMAIAAIRKDLRESVLGARASIREATQQLEEADEIEESARDRYVRAARSIIARAKKKVKDIQTAAKRFGITDGAISIQDAASAVMTLQVSTHAKAKAYADAITELRAVMGSDDPMASAMSADAVPADIAADYLDDHGANGIAIREAHR